MSAQPSCPTMACPSSRSLAARIPARPLPMRPLSDWFLRRWNSVASRRISCLPMPTVNMRWRRSWPASLAPPARLLSPAPRVFLRGAGGVVVGILGAAGQSCVAGSRLFIEECVYAEVLEQVVAQARRLRVAPPDAEGVEMGPLASLRHRGRVIRFVARARAEGGQVLCGGEVPAGAEFTAGAYYLPTVIDGLDPRAATCQEEAFGPVLV